MYPHDAQAPGDGRADSRRGSGDDGDFRGHGCGLGVVQRDLKGRYRCGQRIVLPCQHAEFDELSRVAGAASQRIPGVAAPMISLLDELVGGRQQYLTARREPVAVGPSEDLVLYLGRDTATGAEASMLLQFVFAVAQVRHPQDHQFGVGSAAALPA